MKCTYYTKRHVFADVFVLWNMFTICIKQVICRYRDNSRIILFYQYEIFELTDGERQRFAQYNILSSDLLDSLVMLLSLSTVVSSKSLVELFDD